MLNIGEDVGALIVTMPAAMEGVEVEIRPLGAAAPAADHDHHHDHDHDHRHDHGHGHFVHVAVVGRPVNGTVLYSLVYPELAADTYELYVRPAGPVQLTVSVTGGAVTEAVWPDGV
jgi:hypothetical protein